MDSDTNENFEYLYDEEDAPKHEKLVEKVLTLNKSQNLKKPSRTEPALQVSEYHLVKSITGEKGSVEINELTKPLKNRKSRVKISENVRKAQTNSRTLPKPLEKPHANKIRRTFAYEKTRLQLDRWEPTVTSNRVSTNLSFPLNNDTKMDKKESEQFTKMWRIKSKLAEELEKHEPKVEEFHINLEQEKFPLTMKEMLARRREAAKLRAYQGYVEAKARRQNKIKSKKYHRIQKRARIKRKLKEFEELQKTNPEEALKKLEEIEKSRVEERFSLRHKSTGKWARNQQIRAKYDKESRQNLAQQLKMSQELTQKTKANENSSEEDEEEQTENFTSGTDENNPWINGIKPGKEVANFLSGYRKYWMEQNKQNLAENQETEGNEKIIENENVKKKKTIVEVQETENSENNTDNKSNGEHTQPLKNITPNKKKTTKRKSVNCSKKTLSTSEWEVSDVPNGSIIEEMFERVEHKLQKKMLKNVKHLKTKLTVKKPSRGPKKESKKTKIDLSLPLQKKTPQIDEALIENQKNKEDDQSAMSETLKNINFMSELSKGTTLETTKEDIDVNIPGWIKSAQQADDKTKLDQRAIISEAFEDDDIIDEFNKEKAAEVDKDKPKKIDLSLPGWGSWGGSNIKVSRRKKRRFIFKTPAKIPRRDDNKGFLIINESAQTKVKEHMVSEVPFPFKTVKDFEASMRAPISNTFVPETAYKKLIKPAVTTKMGTIIEPMSKDILLNKN